MNEILDWLQKAAPLIGSFVVPAAGLVANGGALAAFVLIALVTGAAVYWVILWETIWWPAYIAASIVGIFGVLLLLVGAPQLLDDPDEEKPTPAANGQARQKPAKSR